MTTVLMSMATGSSNLDDFEPETKIQTEGHTLTQTGRQNGLEDPDAFWSAHPSPQLGNQHLTGTKFGIV